MYLSKQLKYIISIFVYCQGKYNSRCVPNIKIKLQAASGTSYANTKFYHVVSSECGFGHIVFTSMST